MDSLKTAVANLADLMDRQLALLVDSKYNHGLPQNLTMPASVFSRSTECHNQDKVSMGTIAARDCLRVLELTEQVAAALTMAGVQGVTLRLAADDGVLTELQPEVEGFIKQINKHSAFLDEDRPLDAELRTMTDLIKNSTWALYGST